MKRCLHYLLIIALLLSGCSYQITETIPPTEIHIITEQITVTEPINTEPASTEPQTETAPYLDFEAGSYLERYTDPDTSDYLDYYIHIPENATEKMPLLVFLHGDGEVGYPERLENFGPIIRAREIYGDNFPFIAIFPCTRTYSWISGYIPRTLKALIDITVETYHADTNHIILTGHSRGAIGVWHMISAYGNYFSAGIPISCGPASPLDLDACINVPIWGFVGTVDQIEQNYSRAMKRSVDQIVEHGGTAKLSILENTNHSNTCIDAFTEDTFIWMLSQ